MSSTTYIYTYCHTCLLNNKKQNRKIINNLTIRLLERSITAIAAIFNGCLPIHVHAYIDTSISIVACAVSNQIIQVI